MNTLSWRWLKRLMPKSLYVRTILIIVIPTFIALAVATFVFFDRHWSTTTNRLAYAVSGDIAAIIALAETVPSTAARQEVIDKIAIRTDLFATFDVGRKLDRDPKKYSSPLRQILDDALNERVRFPHIIEARRETEELAIMIETPDGLYTVLVPRKRLYTPTTEVFIGWMLGSSILLSVIALLFMRNQVRPVRRLAEAAEAIGKGQDVPWFKLEGATEVRQAGSALLVMRDRIRRSFNQRTAMLAGVSHDLRTPLTRMRLQLAMMPEGAQTRGILSDIGEMEVMLEGYLAFAKGEEGEATVKTDLAALLEDIVQTARRQHEHVSFKGSEAVMATIRPHALRRCVNNLIGNALRYGKQAQIALSERDHAIDIVIDDDGPGIPEEKREDVFRPFCRLDASRNMDTGGVGLGLTIARDIARAHGGNLVLEDSPLGGLRARIWLPV